MIYSYDVDGASTVKSGAAVNVFYIGTTQQPLCEHNIVSLEVL